MVIAALLFSFLPCPDSVVLLSSHQTGPPSSEKQSKPADSGSGPPFQDDRALELGAVVGREIRAGEKHGYSFKVEAGYYARLIVDQLGIDVLVSVFDGENRLVVKADRPNGIRGPEAVSVIAPVTGVFRVIVAPTDNTPLGRYDIALKERRAAGVDDARRILAERAVFDGERMRGDGSAELLRQAVGKFQQAIGEWRLMGDRYEEAVALYGLAWTFYAQGEFQEAALHFDTALSAMRELNDAFGRAINSIGLAFSHINLGENQGALTYFLQALELHRQLKYRRGEAIALYGIGWVNALLGHDEKALENFLNVLPLRRTIPDRRGEARTLSSIGDMYRRLGNYPAALSYLDQSLKILREINDHYGEANTLSSIGWAYNALAQHGLALSNFNDALRLRREVGDRAGEATTLYGIARTLDQQGDAPGARSRIETALDIIESLRASGASQELRTDYFALVQDYYEFYVDLLMRLHSGDKTAGYDARALQASERGRCRTLLDLLKEAQAGIRQGVDPVLLEQMSSARQELNAATARYRELLTGVRARKGRRNPDEAASGSGTSDAPI
jgi:tetratricopeptide (TPR) repeat protein